MPGENVYDPQTPLRRVTKDDAIAMALSDIHLLRMLARVSQPAEVATIMKGYGCDISGDAAEELARALDGRLTITVRGLVALFNSLEVPKSVAPGVTAPFRGREWVAPPET